MWVADAAAGWRDILDVALELLKSCGMISQADSKLSLGNLLVRELSSQKDYTSIIFLKRVNLSLKKRV